MSRERRLLLALLLNAGIVAAQAIFGFAAHSLGLLADAGHNLTDVGALALALVAVRWVKRPPTEKRSFGYHRGTILSAQANAAAIIAITALIAFEAIRRLLDPVHVRGGIVVVVALIAMVLNGIAALVLRDRSDDLNMRAAMLHVGADAAASLGVAIAGIVILATGRMYWLDPTASLLIGALILWEGWRLMRASTDVLFESTPAGVDTSAVSAVMATVPGVETVHDLHVWSLSSEVRALSAHLVLAGHPTLEEAQAVGTEVKRAVSGPFRIAHATLELECESCVDDGSWCAVDRPDLLHQPLPQDQRRNQ